MPMLYPPSVRNKAFINGTLLKASKSKKILACPADPASPDRSDLVKIYFYPGLAPLKHIFRQSKASREYQVAKEIHKRGVPTILPERVQDIKKWGLLYHQSIVIAKLLPDYMNLEEFFSRQEAQDLHVRRAVIQQYAGLARTIHNQWIYQEDFSPYNILYQKKPGGFFQLYFLDFEKIRIDRELSRQERVRNLAKLNRSARVFKKTGDLNSSDQMRFLKAYLGPQAKKDELREWIRQIRAEEEKIFARDRERTRKKSTSASSRIGVLKYNGYRGYYRKRHLKEKCYNRSDIIQILQSIEKTDITGKAGQPPSEGFQTLTVPLNGSEETFAVRFFRYNGLKYRLKKLTKQTPVLSAWKTEDLALRNRTADFLPVAAVEKRTGRNQYHGFLILKTL